MKKVTKIAGLIAFIPTLTLAQIYTTSDAPISIPDGGGTANPACQTITVAGGPTSITQVGVSVTLTHTWLGDLAIEVTSPAGTTLTIANRPGHPGSSFGDSSDLDPNYPLDFDDGFGLDAEAMGAACPNSGDTVGLDCDDPPDYFPNPDGAGTGGGVGTNFSDFAGEDCNGTWTLCVMDNVGGDSGTLHSWSLACNATIPVTLKSFSIE